MAFPEACSPPRTNESISVRSSRLWVIACLPKPRNLVCDVGASWSWILVGLWNWPAICWSDLPPPPLVASWLFVASMPKFQIQIRFCHACAYRFYKCWSPSGIKASLGSQSFSFALEVHREYHKAPKCFCVIWLACRISSPNGPTLLTQWVPCTHAFRSLAWPAGNNDNIQNQDWNSWHYTCYNRLHAKVSKCNFTLSWSASQLEARSRRSRDSFARLQTM